MYQSAVKHVCCKTDWCAFGSSTAVCRQQICTSLPGVGLSNWSASHSKRCSSSVREGRTRRHFRSPRRDSRSTRSTKGISAAPCGCTTSCTTALERQRNESSRGSGLHKVLTAYAGPLHGCKRLEISVAVAGAYSRQVLGINTEFHGHCTAICSGLDSMNRRNSNAESLTYLQALQPEPCNQSESMLGGWLLSLLRLCSVLRQ